MVKLVTRQPSYGVRIKHFICIICLLGLMLIVNNTVKFLYCLPNKKLKQHNVWSGPLMFEIDYSFKNVELLK